MLRSSRRWAEEEGGVAGLERAGESPMVSGEGAGGRGGWPSSGGYQDSSYDVTEMMSVPSNKVGLVMGKGGETIRSICSESGAHCQVDKSAPDGARDKNIVIKGRPDAVERAKEMISNRIGGGGYDQGPIGGGGVYENGYPAAAGIFFTLIQSLARFGCSLYSLLFLLTA